MAIHPIRWYPALLLGSWLCAGAPPLESFIVPSRICALHRPPGWKVSEALQADSYSLTASAPDGSARVALLWARRRTTALEALRGQRDQEGRSHPGAEFTDLFVSRDGRRGVATERYRASGTAFQGRVFVEAEGQKLTVQSYLAPEAQLSAQRPVLMNVMMSVTFIKGPGAAGSASARPMVERRAPDGSVKLRVPQDWGFLAAKGTVIAADPGGGSGFIFTTFSGNPMLRGASVAQGVIAQTYQPPARTLPIVLVGFGHRAPSVLSAVPDPATVAQYRAAVGRPCEASDLVATWTAKGGVECLGAFKVVNGLPGVTGLWHSIVAGIWGPRKDFARYFPVLEQVAGSYSVNDAYARRYIQAGLDNLRRLQQQTAKSMQDLSGAREDMQKAWEAREARKDYMDSKWDDYRRGDSYWVSDLEGGKVYHTDPTGTRDTRTGDYYEGSAYNWTNFEGQNPRHASETMREVSSYELAHGAPPP